MNKTTLFIIVSLAVLAAGYLLLTGNNAKAGSGGKLRCGT